MIDIIVKSCGLIPLGASIAIAIGLIVFRRKLFAISKAKTFAEVDGQKVTFATLQINGEPTLNLFVRTPILFLPSKQLGGKVYEAKLASAFALEVLVVSYKPIYKTPLSQSETPPPDD